MARIKYQEAVGLDIFFLIVYSFTRERMKRKILLIKGRFEMVKILVVLVFSALLLIFPMYSQSQDSCGCNSVLVTTTIEKNHSDQRYLAILDIVDKENFEEFKRVNGGGGSASFGIPGIIEFKLSGNASFDEFRTERDRIFDLHKYVSRYNENLSERMRYLPDYIAKAWSECQYNCNLRPGIRGAIGEITPEFVVIKFKWTPYPGDQGGHVVTAQRVVGGSNPQVGGDKIFPDGTTFGVFEEKTRIIDRENGKELHIAIDVGSTTESFYVPAFDFHKLFFDGIKLGHFDKVRLALDNGISVNAKTAEGLPALIYANGCGNKQVFNYLVASDGILLNQRDQIGETALFCAAADQQVDNVRLLLEKGANTDYGINNITYQNGNYYRWTALTIARQLNVHHHSVQFDEIIRLLEAKGAVDGLIDPGRVIL